MGRSEERGIVRKFDFPQFLFSSLVYMVLENVINNFTYDPEVCYFNSSLKDRSIPRYLTFKPAGSIIVHVVKNNLARVRRLVDLDPGGDKHSQGRIVTRDVSGRRLKGSKKNIIIVI